MKPTSPMNTDVPSDIALSNSDVVKQESSKAKVPFSLKVIILYLFLLFLIMPASFAPSDYSQVAKEQTVTHQDVGLAARFHRLPLVVGVVMVAVALLTKRPLPGTTLPAASFFVFSLSYLLSGLWGPAGFLESIRLLFATAGIGLCLVLIIRKPKELDFFLKALVAVALANAVYGLFFTIPGLTGLGETIKSVGFPSGKDMYEWRLIGFLGDPTNCGLLLMLGFLIVLDWTFGKLSLSNIALALIFFLAIFLTFSRTTWVATLAGVIFLMWQKKVSPVKIALILVTGGLFFLLTHGIFYFSIKENLFRWHITQSDTRSGVWLFWLGIALKRPLGYGIGYVPYFCAKNSWQPPHNIYLSFWVEGGIQTLIPLLLLLWICFRKQWGIRKYIDPETGTNYGALFLTLLVATSISLLALSFMTQLLFITMGLCLSASLIAKDGLLVKSKSK